MNYFIGFLWRKFLEHRYVARRYIKNSLYGTAAYFVSVTLLIHVWAVSYYVAIPIALASQYISNHFRHSRHTFEVGKLSPKTSLQYLAAFLSVSLAEYVGAIVLVEVLHVGEWIAAVTVMVVAGFVSFFLTMMVMTEPAE